jgi:DNA-binding response OmpR family regulator
MKRVLIVDDAIDLGRLFQDALKTAHPGMPITVVPSAEEALLESFRLTIDLLVTDVRLPGMTGMDLVRKIRVRQPHVKVLMITGLTVDSKMQKQLDEINVDVFRRKPLGITEFLQIADELLGFTAAPQAVEPPPAIAVPLQAASQISRDDELLNALTAALPGEAVSLQEKAARLKKTGTLRLPPPPESSPTSLSARLSGLRVSLGAVAVLLLDDRGRVVAQAGDLPEAGLLEGLVSPLAAALSAAIRISYLLGKSASETVQAYRGQLVDLVAAPVGQYALLLALRPGMSVRLALAFEEALNAQVDLSQALESMGLRVQKAVEVGAPETMLAELGLAEAESNAAGEESLEDIVSHDPGLEQLEALFEKKTNGDVNLPDADSFWEMAASSDKGEETAPGMLNYDQAQKLGLLPENND